jgi:hypothetical protein
MARFIPGYSKVRETLKKFTVNKLFNGYEILLHIIPTSVFFFTSQMLNMPSFGYTTDIYTLINFIPNACQHITVDQSHSSGDTVAI